MDPDQSRSAVWQLVNEFRTELALRDFPVILGRALAEAHADDLGIDIPATIEDANWSHRNADQLSSLDRVRRILRDIAPTQEDRSTLWRTYIQSTSDQDGFRSEITSSVSAERVASAALTRPSRDIPDTPIVWDPCCGTGLLAVGIAERLRDRGAQPRLVLWDVNASAAHSASVSAFLAGIPAIVEQRDCLTWDAHASPVNADIVVADPPMGLDWHRQEEKVEELRTQGAFSWGLPKKADGTWLFLQQLVAGMNATAQAVMFSSMGPLWSLDSNEIRQHLLASALLRAITYLPEGTAATTSIERCVLLLDRTSSPSLRDQVTLINLKDLFRASKPRSRQPRTLLPEALSELEKSLANSKPTRISRTIPQGDLELMEVGITYRRLDFDKRASTALTIPLGTDLQQWATERYGDGESVSVSITKESVVDLRARGIFTPLPPNALPASSVRLSSHLSALVVRTPPGAASQHAGKVGTPHDGAWIVARGDRFVTETSLPSSDAQEVASSSEQHTWSYAFQLDPALDPNYVVRFFEANPTNLTNRQIGRSFAPVRSLRQALSLLDDLTAPIPTVDQQLEQLSLLDRLDLVRMQLDTDIREVWSHSSSIGELDKRIDAYLGNEDLASLLRRWPNPIASAAWIVETTETRPESQERALLRFWEAVSGFHATILLSAIRGIPDVEDETLSTIRDAVSRAGNLNLTEASVGLFSLLSSTCANQIRSRIHTAIDKQSRSTEASSDANAELNQVLQAFGGLSLDLVQMVISRDLSRLFERLRPLRTPGAHGGLETREQLQGRVTLMRNLMLEWDSLTRRVWSDYILVRGGSLERLDDHYLQDVEYIVGNDYPFLPTTVKTVDAMKSGYLYMYVPASSDFMEVRAPLFEFLEVPEEAKVACYYFNRMRGKDLDLKSFVYPKELQGPDVAPRVGQTISWLLGDSSQI